MSRIFAFAALLVIASTSLAAPPEGNWKYQLREADQTFTFLFSLKKDGDKWGGTFHGATVKFQEELKLTSVKADGERLSIEIKMGDRDFLNFELSPNKEGKKLIGSVQILGAQTTAVEIAPTQVTDAKKSFDLARESFADLSGGAEVFELGFEILKSAAGEKMTADDVRGVVEKLSKSATPYGPRWEQFVTRRTAVLLVEQAAFPELAVQQARRAARLLPEDAKPALQIETYKTLIAALEKGGKTDDLAGVRESLRKAEERDYADYVKTSLDFAKESFAGRKGKSDRVVLIEVFTGAECPPCVGVDVACDGVLKAYKPTDVIVLNYHEHIPATDPLANGDTSKRLDYYAETNKFTPNLFVDGTSGPRNGGALSAAKARYQELTESLAKRLEVDSGVKLTLTAKGDKKGQQVTATLSDLKGTGDKCFLRFAVVEERVRYAGGNGVTHHHNVVRAMPGGPTGFALKKKEHEETITIDVAELHSKLSKELDELVKTEGPLPHGERPLELRKLKVVAFVQDDATKEILQATQIPLEEVTLK